MYEKKKLNKKDIKFVQRKIKSLHNIAEKALKDKRIQPSLENPLLQLIKETKASLFFWENLEKSIEKASTFERMDKLQIGGGKRMLPGFINLDIFSPADIIWDCRYGLPFSSNKFSFVFSDHFLEHLDFPQSARKILSEIYRVLSPKGELLIGVPDAGKAARSYCNNQNFLQNLLKKSYLKRKPSVEIYGHMDILNYLFRDQAENPDYTVHHWAYDEKSLKKLLKTVGFENVKKTTFDSKYCNPKRRFYTLYIKAIK